MRRAAPGDSPFRTLAERGAARQACYDHTVPTRFPPAALRWLLAAAVALSGCASLRTRRSDAGSDDASSYAGDATSDSGWSSGPPGTQVQHGFASYYGRRFIGRRTANGEHYDPNKLTAAHRTLPFGSWVEVRANSTGRHVVVRINDSRALRLGPRHRPVSSRSRGARDRHPGKRSGRAPPARSDREDVTLRRLRPRPRARRSGAREHSFDAPTSTAPARYPGRVAPPRPGSSRSCA